jgi:hypothetical protein
MKRELLDAIVGKRQPLKPHQRAVMACLATLLVLLGFVILHATYSIKHYIAFGLLLVPFLVLGEKGVLLFRVAIVSPPASCSSTSIRTFN